VVCHSLIAYLNNHLTNNDKRKNFSSTGQGNCSSSHFLLCIFLLRLCTSWWHCNLSSLSLDMCYKLFLLFLTCYCFIYIWVRQLAYFWCHMKLILPSRLKCVVEQQQHPLHWLFCVIGGFWQEGMVCVLLIYWSLI
jgi:hypothetical protein